MQGTYALRSPFNVNYERRKPRHPHKLPSFPNRGQNSLAFLVECRVKTSTSDLYSRLTMSHLPRSFATAPIVIVVFVTAIAYSTGSTQIAVAADEPTKPLPTLFIVGDSTVKNGTKGQQGWGDPLMGLFDKTKIKVENHAIGGRSSRTFQTEGRWDKILAAAKPGDFVVVQMGHNDSGPLDDAQRARGSIRGIGDESKEINNPITKQTETVHTYGWYLRKYIHDAKEKQMIVIILSPIPHCPEKQVAPGDIEKSNYVTWSEEVAKAEKVPFLHLNKLIMAHYATLPPAEIKTKYFTEADHTHTSPAGAAKNAECVAAGIRELTDVPLKDFLQAPEAAK